MLRKTAVLIPLLFVFVAACSSSSTGPAQKSTARPASTTARPATADSNPAVAEQGAAQDSAASSGYTLCEKETEKQCPDGYEDGCSRKVTLYHVCIKQGAAPGPPCEKEVTTQCFPGEKDACLVDPAVAKFHICFKP